MPNLEWSKMNPLQLGRYGEYYAKMEFSSYGMDVYTSEVDDHGVDFVAKTKNGTFIEIQVKSVRVEKTQYVFMTKEHFNLDNDNLYLMLQLFEEDKLPLAYLIKASEWKNENELLRDRNYDGLKSKPEYGINLSKKNKLLLQKYLLENIIVLL